MRGRNPKDPFIDRINRRMALEELQERNAAERERLAGLEDSADSFASIDRRIAELNLQRSIERAEALEQQLYDEENQDQ